MWRSEIHINIKIDAGVAFVTSVKIYHIYQVQQRQYTGMCACAYCVCRVKNKIESETYITDSTSNLI